jgi:hypothetical protein
MWKKSGSIDAKYGTSANKRAIQAEVRQLTNFPSSARPGRPIAAMIV